MERFSVVEWFNRAVEIAQSGVKPKLIDYVISPVRAKILEDDGTSKILWRVYPPDVSIDQIEADFPEFAGVEIRGMYDCTGRWFAHPADVKRTRTRILVTQWWGLDI